MNLPIRLISAAYNKILSTVVAICCGLIVLMMLSIGASALFRQSAINFAWALEVSEYILIITTLLSSGWLLKRGGHVRVDILATFIHGKKREFHALIVFGIVSLACLCFMFIGLNATVEAYQSGVIEEKVYLKFPKWILLSLFPLSGLFMTVEALKLSVSAFKKYFLE